MKNLFLNLPRFRKQLIAAAFDFVFLPALFCFALYLHFEKLSIEILRQYGWIAIAISAISLRVFVSLGLYRAVIRYIDQKIILVVLIGATLSTLMLITLGIGATLLHLTSANIVHPSLACSYWLDIILYLLASRFIARGYLQNTRESRKKDRVAIYGAGEAGIQLANALKPGFEYNPIFFIDDNKQIQNTTIGGIKVFSPDQLPQLLKAHNISTILLAIPSLLQRQQRQILDALEPLTVKIKITPPIASLVKGTARVEDVRQIEIEDLLGRDPVKPNSQLLSTSITGKSVMVSGAGGSIGSELCRQIIALKPKRLVLFDISEFSLYTIEQELQAAKINQCLELELVACIGSVLNIEHCKQQLSAFAIETVYHAAAYKHVPLVEQNPIEGIRNNVFGTLNFAKAAMAANVKCFVLISTDKAVRPTNVMGATKRLAELILQAFANQGSSTTFSMVRFGNVLGSSGSVVPLFRKQIATGGPITLTHTEITRYFMTIPEAAQLVLQAGSMSEGGDVFVLDMGEPVRILDLATRMVHLSGHEVKTPATPNGTIEIQSIGLRPGEKLYEELLIGNNATGTLHPLIMRAEEAAIDWPLLEIMLEQLDNACTRYDHKDIRAQLLKMVREYQPNSDIADLTWKIKDHDAKDHESIDIIDITSASSVHKMAASKNLH